MSVLEYLVLDSNALYGVMTLDLPFQVCNIWRRFGGPFAIWLIPLPFSGNIDLVRCQPVLAWFNGLV